LRFPSRRRDANNQADADMEARYQQEVAGPACEFEQNTPTQTTGEGAGTDTNGGHDAGGTACEISGSRRHGSNEVDNTFALTARFRKRNAICAVLRNDGSGLAVVRSFTLSQWAQLAQRAGVKLPGPETRRMIIEVLEQQERR